MGMGIGQLVVGPISDRFGRRPVVVGGLALYSAAALAGWMAQSLEMILVARVFQGIGAAGPRIMSLSIVRDRFSGDEMARTMSFVMMIFGTVPAFAPALGHWLVGLGQWRLLFMVYVIFAGILLTWFLLRQPETLRPEHRRHLTPRDLWQGTLTVVRHPTARRSMYGQTLVFGLLLSTISSMQPIFDVAYGRGETFHLWFAGIALVSISASWLNARLVVRVGMRGMVKAVLRAQIGIAGAMVVIILAPVPPGLEFACLIVWMLSIFYVAGLSLGNLNTLALEPMGHIAGLASSIIASLPTFGAILIAVPIGLAFNGTALPLACGAIICAAVGVFITNRIERATV